MSAEGVQLLKRVQENVIKMLAEKQVDTNVYGAADAGDRPKKENEQNVKNRAREIRFNAHNQRFVCPCSLCARTNVHMYTG